MQDMRALLLLFVLRGAHAAPAGQNDVFFELKSPRVLDRGMAVSREQFTAVNIKRLAQMFYKETAHEYALARLTIGPTKEQVIGSLWHLRPQTSYQDEAEKIRSGTTASRVARVLIWNGAGVLSIREGETLSSEGLDAHRSMIVLKQDGVPYELLHFVLSPNGAPATPKDKYFLWVYFRATPPYSVSNCQALTKRLRTATGAGTVVVDVRPDIWFFGHTHYPYLLPFVPTPKFPTEGELDRTRWIACGDNWRKGSSCDGSGLAP